MDNSLTVGLGQNFVRHCIRQRALLIIVCTSLLALALVWKNAQTTDHLFSGRSNKVGSYVPPRKLFKQKCNGPVHHVTYLKTHKTGSTTVVYILKKHMKRHKVKNWAKPYPSPFIGGYPGRVKFRFVKTASGMKAESLVGHFRFDANELRANLPADSRYITILRNPWDAFQSSCQYYGAYNSHRVNGANCFHMPVAFVASGLNMTINQYAVESLEKLNSSVPWYFRSMNYQAHDLGMDPTLDDDKEVQRQIIQLDKMFDLVMIADYMDESLILLKELLCMDDEDINYGDIYMNKRSYETEMLQNENVFRKLNNLDIALYEHFNASFWRKVDVFGRDRMQAEANKLRYEVSQINSTFNYQKLSFSPPDVTLKTLSTDSEIVDRIIHSPRSYNFPVELQYDLAKYMQLNSGGCLNFS